MSTPMAPSDSQYQGSGGGEPPRKPNADKRGSGHGVDDATPMAERPRCERCNWMKHDGMCRCASCASYGHFGIPCTSRRTIPSHTITEKTAERLEDIARPLVPRLRQDLRQFLATLQDTTFLDEAVKIVRGLANALADDYGKLSPTSFVATAGSSPSSSIASSAPSFPSSTEDDPAARNANGAAPPQGRSRAQAPSPEPGSGDDAVLDRLMKELDPCSQEHLIATWGPRASGTMTLSSLPLRPGPGAAALPARPADRLLPVVGPASGAGLPPRPYWLGNDNDDGNDTNSSSSRPGAADKRKADCELAKGGSKKKKRGD